MVVTVFVFADGAGGGGVGGGGVWWLAVYLTLGTRCVALDSNYRTGFRF